MKKILNKIKHLTIITVSYIISANHTSAMSFQSQTEVRALYGVDPPATPLTIGMSIWDKILYILFSPIALIIYLIIIIIGIIILVKKRNKHNNAQKSS